MIMIHIHVRKCKRITTNGLFGVFEFYQTACKNLVAYKECKKVL